MLSKVYILDEVCNPGRRLLRVVLSVRYTRESNPTGLS